MNSWKIILATVVIFGAGVLTGGLLVHYVDQARPANVDQQVSGPNPPAHPDNRDRSRPAKTPLPPMAEKLGKLVQQLNESLKLTPEQREVIAKIVADGQERIRTNVAPLMRKVMQDVNQQIREQLTPEQQKKFEALMKPRAPRKAPGANAPLNRATPTNLPPTNAPGA
jgi:Spy/CpxP family protein refolding chaperone